MTKFPTRRELLATAVLTAACATLPVAAQGPVLANKPIRMIVSVGAGGATDSLSRRLAERLAKSLGQPVLVENLPGASGVIAAQTVARAAPDGLTLLIGTNTTHAGNASFLKNLPYDPIHDFEPVALMATAALVLCVNERVPVKNLGEYIAYARANPGKVTYGSGTGSARLASEMLKAKAGLDMMSVPYKSNAQALQDLRGGQIQMLFGDIALMLPQIRANAVKALGVSSARRSATMPEMPTLQEQGVAGYELAGFIAAFAPAKTPEPIVRKLNEEITNILREKDFADAMTAAGVDAAPSTPQQLRDFVVSETKKWGALARAAGIQPE
jgi:tripartite-type tricarboxylate transporter receptor subunit TctC